MEWQNLFFIINNCTVAARHDTTGTNFCVLFLYTQFPHLAKNHYVCNTKKNSMKRLIFTIILAITAITASAQTDFSTP